MASPATSVREWLDERFPLDDLKALAQEKEGAGTSVLVLVFSRRHDAVPIWGAGRSLEHCC